MIKPYFLSAVQYARTHKKHLLIGALSVVSIIAAVVIVLLYVESQRTKILYSPMNACNLLLEDEARDLLGRRTLQSDAKTPVITGDVAVSRCGYTDGNPDVEAMLVAAIMVRSAINDDGVTQNNDDFFASKATDGKEAVDGIGDGAYFDTLRGQLHILDERKWIILSYGTGSAPEANTLDDALALAKKIVGPASEQE